jgi:hypothetical protein
MKNIILFGSVIVAFLILTGSAAADNQTSEQTPEQTSTENDTNLPGFSLFAALSVLLIIVHMKQKKN